MTKETKQKLPARIEQSDGSVKLKLKEPVRFGEEQIPELIIKKPKAKHLRKIKLQDMDFDELLKLAAVLTGQPDPVLDELCWDDAFELVEVVGDFLPDSAKDGNPISP